MQNRMREGKEYRMYSEGVKTLNPERGKIQSTERSYTGARRNRTQGHKECYNVGSGLGFNLCVAPLS